MKLTSITKFELLYNAKKAYTYIFFVLLIFQGIWYTVGVNDLFANNNIMLNAPAINYRNLSVMGIILFAITAIISAGALARDLESGAANILYPMVIHEKTYFCGKYVGVVLVNLVVVLGYPLGILLFPFLGMGAPEQFGSAPLGQLLHGFVLFTVPNLIFLITFAVFLVVIFRKATAAYLGILLILIFFLVAVSIRDDSVYTLVIELLDPFGYCCVERITDRMDALELNTAYLPVTTTLLLNRLIWGFVSILLLTMAFLKFNFKTFIARFSKKIRQEKNRPASQVNPAITVSLDHGTKACLIKSVKFAWGDLKNLFKSPIFFAVMVTLFLMFLGYNFLWTSAYYLTTSHLPLTSAMTFIRIPMMLVISIMLLILSGELLFKDRTSGVWQIADAMPTPSWVFVLSRWLTLGAIAGIISSLIFSAGIVSQWGMGFTDIEWGLYVRDLYGSRFGWLTSLHIISLAFFCGALFNSRLKGHIFSIAVFVFIVMSVDHKLIEQLHFAFPVVPAILGPEKYNYSEMNGYGVLDTGLAWYAGAWTALAGLFLVLTLLLWNRGVNRTLKERWHAIRQKLRPPGGRVLTAAMIGCLALFGFFQYGIHDNLISKAGCQTEAQKEVEAAAYEKRYAGYRQLPQPKIADLNLTLDLFPEKREAAYKARLVLENKAAVPMDTLHLDWDKKLTIIDTVSENTPLEMLEEDAALRHAIYRLQTPLAPGKTMNLNIKATLAYKGFHQSDYQGDLTYNGTVLGTDVLPFFGYDRSRELDNNKKRLRRGLDLVDSRMDKIDNAFSRSNRFESVQSDALTWNMVVGTCASQSIVGPGNRVKSWQTKGRNYAHFRSEHPGLLNFKIISARLATKAFHCGGISCSLSHEPRHTYNLTVFQKAMQKAIPWLSRKLGPYPHTFVQVVEKPFYDADFITFANVTAISEARGWTADIQQPEDGQYIYQAVAGELAKHWIEAALKVANVQGAGLLTESIAQYYGLRFMDETWGHAQTAKWLDKAYEDYEKGKGKEAIEEKPLLYVDKASYLARNKGGLALYAMAQRIGGQNFDRWLRNWLAPAGQKNDLVTSVDFYGELKNFLPTALHPFVLDWFEKRIQYRLSLVNASVKDQKLVLTLSAAKWNHGTKGVIEEPFSSPLEVGLADGKGQLQTVKQVMLQPGTHTYDLTADFIPAAIILDPYYWYLIENRQRCSRPL